MMNLMNMPEYADHYEFVVVLEIDGDYWFWCAYSDGFKAEQVAMEIGGVIVHNVRIQGYKP